MAPPEPAGLRPQSQAGITTGPASGTLNWPGSTALSLQEKHSPTCPVPAVAPLQADARQCDTANISCPTDCPCWMSRATVLGALIATRAYNSGNGTEGVIPQ